MAGWLHTEIRYTLAEIETLKILFKGVVVNEGIDDSSIVNSLFISMCYIELISYCVSDLRSA